MTVGPCAWWEHRIRTRRHWRDSLQHIDTLELRTDTGRVIYRSLQIQGSRSTVPEGPDWSEYVRGLQIYINDVYIGKMP